jgi:hypothetical protein
MRSFLSSAFSDISVRLAVRSAVAKATSNDKVDLDEAEAIQVVELANSTPALVIDAVKSRLSSSSLSAQLLALQLLQFLVNNCCQAVHDEIARGRELHARLLELAIRLQDSSSAAASAVGGGAGIISSAVRVRMEARRLVLDWARTFRGSSAAHQPLQQLQQRYEAVCSRKLERSVLMERSRVKIRDPTEADVRYISPRRRPGDLASATNRLSPLPADTPMPHPAADEAAAASSAVPARTAGNATPRGPPGPQRGAPERDAMPPATPPTVVAPSSSSSIPSASADPTPSSSTVASAPDGRPAPAASAAAGEAVLESTEASRAAVHAAHAASAKQNAAALHHHHVDPAAAIDADIALPTAVSATAMIQPNGKNGKVDADASGDEELKPMKAPAVAEEEVVTRPPSTPPLASLEAEESTV